MKKLINWTCGSFFRTLGRFAFYILIGYILSCLINFKEIKLPSLWDVYAETITPNYGIDINGSNFDGYKYLGNSKNGNPQNARIELYQDSINALDYNFIIIDVCSTNDIKVSRTANVGNSCTNSCFSNAMGITKTTLTCKSNGYDGYIYRVNGSILKWYIGSGSSTIYSVNDQISLVNDKSNNVPISIYGVYISDTENIQNMTIDYTQNFNNIINNQNANSQATRDALTDETGPNINGLGNSAGWLPAGPVDSILNLPLSFLTNLNNNLSRTCEPVNLPLPYVNKTLPLPCLNSVYNEIDGLPNWLNTIGIIASAFILFGYFINLYKYIDDTLTFRENNYIDNWSGV